MEIREVKMDRPFHKHPLLLSEWLRNRRARKCKGCRKRFSGGDMVYACEKGCQFYLHESCAKLPEQIQHFLHPSCPLFLRFSSYSCDSCLKTRSGAFNYRCEECYFKMDVKCALQVPSTNATCDGEEEQILHFCHRHPLTLFPVGTESRFTCQVCNLSCSSLQTWGCRSKQCDFYVHKYCLERLPQRFLTKLGQKVVSLFMQRFRAGPCSCIDCRVSVELGFRSGQIDENDILCISCCLVRRMEDESGKRVPKVIHDFFHPCRLKLVFAPFSTCNACVETGSDFIYNCRYCDFFLDPQCAQLLEVCNEKKVNEIQNFCHWHPLKLFGDTNESENLCTMCEKFCSESFYGCSHCHFFIHKSCMESLPHLTSYCSGNLVVLVLITFFACTNCNRECSGLSFYCRDSKGRFCVKCVLLSENVFGDAGRFTSIHHWHQLSPYETRKEDEAYCFLCKEYCICGTDNYKCNECASYFHKSCAELPREQEHPMHPQHQLILKHRGLGHNTDKCSVCFKELGGVQKFYGCNECHFSLNTECASPFCLDTQCASSLPSLEYARHAHPLYIIPKMYGDRRTCHACRESCETNSTVLRCPKRGCSFDLHLTCGPLPVTIKHKCHVHPLILQDYFVEDNEADEFACHVCEEKRDPRLPVYCCSQGCLMICDVECMVTEVIPLLRGERGEVEVRTAYPPVACKVIYNKETKLVPTREEAGDGNSGTGHVFSFEELMSSLHVSSFEELISSFPGFGSKEEETFGRETSDEGNEPNIKPRTESDESSTSAEEDESQSSSSKKEVESQGSSSEEEEEEFESQSRCKEPYSYSWEALSRFGKHFRTPSFRVLKRDFLWQHDGSATTGEYALPEILNTILEEFLGMYKITDDKYNLSYPQKRFLILTICCVLYEMRITKVADVTKETMLQWLGCIRFVEKLGGLDAGFVVEYFRQLWEAHFYLESRKIVDKKSEWLRQRIEKVSLDRAKLKTKLEKAEARLERLKLSKKDHDAYRAAGGKWPEKGTQGCSAD